MKEEMRVVSVRLPVRLLKEADRIAEKRDLSQAKAIRMCLDIGVECHKDMESLGLIGAVDLINYVRQSIKGASRGRKQLSLPI